jgi:uncharacterized membrane protein YdjX (TVP38/TMEM64 family)
MSLNTRKDLLKDIARVILLVAVFTAIALALKRPDIRNLLFDIDTMRGILQGGPDTGQRIMSWLIFTLAAGALITLGMPRLWASAVGGIVYGAFLGTLLSLIASCMGAALLYLAGYSVLASVVERRSGETLKLWRARFRENAFWWVLYGRFFPFSNSTLMSLVCGSCRVPFSPFMTGSLIGFVPLAVVFATYGSAGVKGNMWQVVLATVFLVLAIFSRRLMERYFPARASAGMKTDKGAPSVKRDV